MLIQYITSTPFERIINSVSVSSKWEFWNSIFCIYKILDIGKV
jgi:hypothetical protein